VRRSGVRVRAVDFLAAGADAAAPPPRRLASTILSNAWFRTTLPLAMEHPDVVPPADAEVLRFMAAALGRPEDDRLVAEVGTDTADIWTTLYYGIYRRCE
jgi:hypothetical protein